MRFLSNSSSKHDLKKFDLLNFRVIGRKPPPPPPPQDPALSATVMETLPCQALIFLGKAIIVLLPRCLRAPGCVPPEQGQNSCFVVIILTHNALCSPGFLVLVCLPWIQIDLRWHSGRSRVGPLWMEENSLSSA